MSEQKPTNTKSKAAEKPKASTKSKAAEKPKASTKSKAAEKPKASTKSKAAEKPKKDSNKNGGQIIIDGTDLIAGRVSSNVAKLLRKGNRVSIINCDKIMISGRKASIVDEYKQFLKIASILHPKHGPFHPRRPDTMMKRMIRGMLPKEKPSKKTDLERLRTYVGSPSQLKTLERTQIENARITKSTSNYTRMSELSKYVGWTQ